MIKAGLERTCNLCQGARRTMAKGELHPIHTAQGHCLAALGPQGEGSHTESLQRTREGIRFGIKKGKMRAGCVAQW